PTRIETELAERRFDPWLYVNFVWRHWKLIAATTAIVLVVALIYLASATPLYTASTQVLLEMQRERAPGNTSSDHSVLEQAAVIENEVAVVRSDSLMGRVVNKEQLAGPPAVKEVQRAEQDLKAAEAKSIQNGINHLRGGLEVKRSGQASVLDI